MVTLGRNAGIQLGKKNTKTGGYNMTENQILLFFGLSFFMIVTLIFFSYLGMKLIFFVSDFLKEIRENLKK